MFPTPADEPLDSRHPWTLGTETLVRLLDDGLVPARAVRTQDFRRLDAIARRGLDESMADRSVSL